MSTDHATAHPATSTNDPLAIEQNAAADPFGDVFDRANTFHAELGADADVDELRRELADTRVALEVTESALCRERPAPDPRALGHALMKAFFRNPGALVVSPHERWTWAAETAIDILRGLMPVTNVAEGGDGATAASSFGSAAVTGAPALGDTPADDLARAMWERESFVRHTSWDVLRPHIRSFYLARARAALDHLRNRGWQPSGPITGIPAQQLARTGLLIPARGDRPLRTITWTGDALQTVLQREIGCETVTKLAVPNGVLVAWFDEEAWLQAVRPAPNERAMRLLRIDSAQPLLGNVVVTGPADTDGATLGVDARTVERLSAELARASS